MADENKLYFIASDVCLSQQKSNDIFILIEARLLSTRANQNLQGVTLAFIDEVVANQQKYECLPLYCDTERLLRGDHMRLGHMMTENGQFGTTQIGAITSFKKQDDEYGTSLIAEIRIPKRQVDVCENVLQIYAEGNLNFSFEISYDPNHVVVIDGVQYVDAHDGNTLCGMCLVSVPAYPQSTALMLTAERDDQATEVKGVEQGMDKEQIESAIAEGIAQGVAAKEAEMAQAIAEKDAIITERDTRIAELEQMIAEKEDQENKDMEEALPEQQEPEDQKNAVAQEDKDKACASTETATAGRYEMECMQEEINRLRVELAAAAAAKAELEAIKAEMAAKELETQQAMAKAFAEKQGLDVEDETVCKAIAEVDYKMIAELSMKCDDISFKHENVVVASIVNDGFEIKGGKYDDLLASRNN